MIPLQQARLDELATIPGGECAGRAKFHEFDVERQQPFDRAGRKSAQGLAERSDPIIQALIRMAECYVYMKQPDEARTILHRLIAHATLTPEQQQRSIFKPSIRMSSAPDRPGQSGVDGYLSKHAGDPQADSISYQIAAKLLERKDYTGALAQAVRT